MNSIPLSLSEIFVLKTGSRKHITGEFVKLPVREGCRVEEKARIEGSTLRFRQALFQALGLEH